MGYWLKLYTDILDDPKYFKLSDAAKLGFYEILLVAKKIEGGDITGKLPSIDDIAFHTRKSVDQWNEILPEFESLGMIEYIEDKPTIKNYKKRQESIPVKERVKQYRKRRNDNSMDTNTISIHECNEDVTESNGETEYRIQNTDKKQIEADSVPVDKKVKELLDFFIENTNLHPVNDRMFTSKWIKPITEMLRVGGKVDRAKEILLLTIKDCDRTDYTFSTPYQIQSRYNGIAAKQGRKKPAGTEFDPSTV